MPHFQNEREDAMAMSDQNKKLDRIIVLLEELTGHSRKALEHAARETEQRDAAKRTEDERKKADAEARKREEEQSRENQRRQQDAQRRAPEQSRDENSLFGETAPLPPAQMNVQGRNAVMASESDREQQSQRDNVFHRDVGDKKD